MLLGHSELNTTLRLAPIPKVEKIWAKKGFKHEKLIMFSQRKDKRELRDQRKIGKWNPSVCCYHPKKQSLTEKIKVNQNGSGYH